MFKKYDRKRCKPVIDDVTDWALVGEGRILRRSPINYGLIYEYMTDIVALKTGDLLAFSCQPDRTWPALMREAAEIFMVPVEVKRVDSKIMIKYAGTWRTQDQGRILLRIPQRGDSFETALSA